MPSKENERPIAAKVTENSFYALVAAFRQSPKFQSFAEETRRLWSRELDFACRPGALGAIPLEILRPSVIQGYLNGWYDRPGKQAAALAAFHALEKWAIVHDLLPRSITIGVETGKPTGGHVPWTDVQVGCAIQCARSDIARAIVLGANTGQRLSDLIRMGPTDIETFRGIEGINVTQKKTGRQVWIPILSTLQRALNTWERQPGPFLRRLRPVMEYKGGRPVIVDWVWTSEPWTREALTSAWAYEVATNDKLTDLRKAGLVLHGLRGHACVALYRSGCTTRQVADMVGMSEPMVGRYTRLSVQRENAVAAVIHLERAVRDRAAKSERA